MGGDGKGAVITLVERSTRFVLLAPLPDTHKAIDLRRGPDPDDRLAARPDPQDPDLGPRRGGCWSGVSPACPSAGPRSWG